MKAKRVWARRVGAPAVAACAIGITGCTTYVTSQVTAFSDWRGSDATRTYAFARAVPQQNSIEQSTYEQLVASELDLYSFKRVPSADARFLVGLLYTVRGDAMTVTQPVYYGHPWPGPYWRPIDPWGPFGPFPAGYVSQTYPVFTHTLGIRITERSTGEEVYNVTARSTNDASSLLSTMPYLVRSALADFPLGNGVVRTVRIRVDKQGRAASNEVPVAPPPANAPVPGGAAAVPR